MAYPTDPTGYLSIPLELIRGMPWKRSARMATTGNVTLSGLQIIDGVVGVSGDRVLVKDNTDASENGLYNMLAGAWTRVFDLDQDLTSAVPADEVSGSFVYVRDGAVHGGQLWHVTNADPAVLGTDDITFEQFSGGAGASALDDLSDVTITTPAEDDTLRYVAGSWVNDARRWEPVTFDPGTGPEIVFTATDIVMTWETY